MGNKKNSKKTFSDKLGLFFQENLPELDEQIEDAVPTTETKKGKNEKKKAVSRKSKKAKKSFSSNLEELFKENLDILNNIVSDVQPKTVEDKNKNKLLGLDFFVTPTAEQAKYRTPKRNNKDNNAETKRVTVILDTEKLEELKRIAKEEKRRLHQIIGELVEDYLDNKE